MKFGKCLRWKQAEKQLERVLIGKIDCSDIMPLPREMHREMSRDETRSGSAFGGMTEDQGHQARPPSSLSEMRWKKDRRSFFVSSEDVFCRLEE